MIMAEYCTADFDDHVTALQQTLKVKCETMIETIAAEFGTAAEVAMPAGGIVVWVTLPDSVDTMKLYQAALEEGVAINPGEEWMADAAAGKHRLRLCYASSTLEDIREGVAKLADICHREFGPRPAAGISNASNRRYGPPAVAGASPPADSVSPRPPAARRWRAAICAPCAA